MEQSGKFSFLLLLLFLISPPSSGQSRLEMIGKSFPIEKLRIHDPVMIQQDSIFYLFSTGTGINVISSSDLQTWRMERPVFSEPPTWALQAVPGFKGHIWAPDIRFFNGQYYLYYSVSAFGKNTSCIGVATNKTLNPNDSDFKWVDHGKVIQSYPGITHWNAIDPNLVVDDAGHPWLSFGSFWDGLKIMPLSGDGLSVEGDTILPLTIASRHKSLDDRSENPIEAPFIIKKNRYYYLFCSIDYCCKGIESSYKMIVGRSRQVTGPYLDKEGNDLAKGGGTLLLKGDERWSGVGHNGIATIHGEEYIVYHAYDKEDNGISRLKIEKLNWRKGWPEIILNKSGN